jgi:phospholipase C
LRTQFIRKYGLLCCTAVYALAINAFSPATGSAAAVPNATNDGNTATPIQHVIVVIGENRAFDHIYCTYTPKSGDKILNLLSVGIVRADGSPGPHFVRAQQFTTLGQTSYFISVPKAGKTAYKTLPPPTLSGAPMWQQSDCGIHNAKPGNPTGCLNDLYPFVITTYAGATADKGGGTSMAFYNVQDEDAPLFKKLADEYTINDNYHQPGQGGTGIQHVFLGTGDDMFWSDGNGKPAMPPAGQIANPNPQSGSNNQYTVDGRFSNCSDAINAPGVLPIVRYLDALPYPAEANCVADHYYMLNNTNPGFLPNGVVDTSGISKGTSIPPSSLRTIGGALNDKHVSWAYYGGAYNAAVNLANGSTNPADAVGNTYCNICNFESYASSIMGDPAQRQTHIKDVIDFYAAVADGSLPAVSFVKPDGLLDGHPASSKLGLLEGMLQKIVGALDANPALKATTALFITFDEGGGYYDSGFIQPLDFFGDGPRIPLVVVSPYSTGGHVVHSYNDHVSILKFIERNWSLEPLTGRSRDNLRNPTVSPTDPYLPLNSPAIGDLFDMFQFGPKG